MLLSLVAVLTKSLQILGIVGTTLCDGDDVIDFQFDGVIGRRTRAALAAAVVIALENDPAVLQRHGLASRCLTAAHQQLISGDPSIMKCGKGRTRFM